TTVECLHKPAQSELHQAQAEHAKPGYRFNRTIFTARRSFEWAKTRPSPRRRRRILRTSLRRRYRGDAAPQAGIDSRAAGIGACSRDCIHRPSRGRPSAGTLGLFVNVEALGGKAVPALL